METNPKKKKKKTKEEEIKYYKSLKYWNTYMIISQINELKVESWKDTDSSTKSCRPWNPKTKKN